MSVPYIFAFDVALKAQGFGFGASKKLNFSSLIEKTNIFCDWPCNLIGPNTVCPSHKRVLMRDRQQISGGISQQDVLVSTCQNTQTAKDHLNTNWDNERSKSVPVMNSETFVSLNSNSKSNPVVVSKSTLSIYVPCTITSEWFNSPQVIKCSNEHRMFGFAPDPKDCTRFYRCDQAASHDGLSTGSLYSCIGGLYWDQTRRMCVPPSESTCDPMYIIKQNLKNGSSQTCPGHTCNQVGLSAKNQMKMVSGKPNSYYRCDVFDNLNHRCEWLAPQFRMASLRASDSFNKVLQHQKRMNLDGIKSNVEMPLVADEPLEKQNQTSSFN
ncbi:hypothetical protein BpHYR1_021741 [Brachionus plicatilis]|uniref:Chitin-binding type-2 domain-containing protein n=1 Tax=Brachionus plicatilis TaxID=10195 RepID=A0A3M7SXZ3_BRAPC|nr:hypothetical protein BpHYR1_021741 [Brachionus plicatilis]